MTTNKKVLQFVDEAVALAKPDKVVWIDGSEAQLEALRKEAIASGEMIKLNDEKLPGCLYHRTKPNDVARVEGRTFICSRRKEDAGSSVMTRRVSFNFPTRYNLLSCAKHAVMTSSLCG